MHRKFRCSWTILLNVPDIFESLIELLLDGKKKQSFFFKYLHTYLVPGPAYTPALS